MVENFDNFINLNTYSKILCVWVIPGLVNCLFKIGNKIETLISEALLIKRYNPILNKQLTKPGITHTLRIFD